MKTSPLHRFLIILIATAAGVSSIAASAQTDGSTVNHVAGRSPIRGFSREMSAERPATPRAEPAIHHVSPKPNPWKLQATLPGAVIHDISFPTAKIGYAAAELGQVWKTTNGGSKWSRIMNLGFPIIGTA